MLADYASHELIPSAHAVDAAQTRLIDALACAFGAVHEPGCRRVLDTLVAQCPGAAGIPVPATHWVLDPQLEGLRARVRLIEHAKYSRGHHDPEVRSCANAIEIEFTDGKVSEHVEALFPAVDPRQGDPGGVLLAQKFASLAGPVLGATRLAALQHLFAEPEKLRSLPLVRFLAVLVVDGR